MLFVVVVVVIFIFIGGYSGGEVFAAFIKYNYEWLTLVCLVIF